MKRILITGANKGIGLATAKKLLESYSETYVLLGSRDFKKGKQALETLLKSSPKFKNRVKLIQIDVEQDYSVNLAAEKIVENFGKTFNELTYVENEKSRCSLRNSK